MMDITALSIWLADAGWIPLAVIGAIWLLTALATAGSKKKKPVIVPISKKGPAAKQPPRARINVQPTRKPGRPKKRPSMIPPPLPTAPPVTAVKISRPAPPTAPVASRPTPPVASAAAIHNWLNPQALRQQFILTELLQEPVALRGEDRSRRN